MASSVLSLSPPRISITLLPGQYAFGRPLDRTIAGSLRARVSPVIDPFFFSLLKCLHLDFLSVPPTMSFRSVSCARGVLAIAKMSPFSSAGGNLLPEIDPANSSLCPGFPLRYVLSSFAFCLTVGPGFLDLIHTLKSPPDRPHFLLLWQILTPVSPSDYGDATCLVRFPNMPALAARFFLFHFLRPGLACLVRVGAICIRSSVPLCHGQMSPRSVETLPSLSHV